MNSIVYISDRSEYWIAPMWTYPSYSGQHDMSKTLLLIGSKLPNSFKTLLSDIVFREDLRQEVEPLGGLIVSGSR